MHEIKQGQKVKSIQVIVSETIKRQG